MMARPAREKKIADLPSEIRHVAHRHLAEQGTGGLSLRSIARELNITAPAIYNYFPRLDDLLTALLVDTFNALGDALDAAISTAADDDFAGRFLAIGQAYRRWAIENPRHYSFIFGDPIPGYHAPEEATATVARRGMVLLITTLEGAYQAGKLTLPAEARDLTPELREQFELWSQSLPRQISPGILYLALTSWAHVHGMVSLEMDNQMHGIIGDPETLYRYEMESILRQMGLI